MAANTRLAVAVHIMCAMAYFERDGVTSETLADSLETNPVVVRRLLKSLERAGLVEIRQGKNGGVKLARAPKEITVAQIYEAVESDMEVFAMPQKANLHCVVSCSMKGLLEPLFGAANEAVQDTLRRTSLATLVKGIA